MRKPGLVYRREYGNWVQDKRTQRVCTDCTQDRHKHHPVLGCMRVIGKEPLDYVCQCGGQATEKAEFQSRGNKAVTGRR